MGKILAWECVHLSDLLPEQLCSSGASQIVVIPEHLWDTNLHKKSQIPDIATWVKVFCTYLLDISTDSPEALPELITSCSLQNTANSLGTPHGYSMM